MLDQIVRKKAIGKYRPTPALIERFENRCLFSSVVVNTLLDSTDSVASSTVSLRDAIARANASSTPTAITFDPGVFATAATIVLNGTQLALVNGSTSITGPVMPLTISANGKSRVLVIGPDATANLSNLTLSGGNVSTEYGGGGIANYGKLVLNNSTITDSRSTGTKQSNNQAVQGYGGGLENLGSATCDNDTFSSNASVANGGGIDNYTNAFLTLTDCTITANSAAMSGGGVSNGGTVTMVDDTVTGNSSTLGGGGIGSDNVLTLTNVTVTGNRDTGSYFGGGGGIFIANDTGFGIDGVATLTNVTITGNLAEPGFGGGMKVEEGAETPQVGNTIIAGNLVISGGVQPGVDVIGGYTSNGTNLIGDTDGSTGFGSADLTGTTSNLLDPMLAALADNGGPTQTAMPVAGSPAIDHGNNGLVPSSLAFDQTDAPRISNGTVDIGAVEVQSSNPASISTQTQLLHDDIPAPQGAVVSFTADVVPSAAGSSGATGTVTFESAGATLGVEPLVDGSATLTLTSLPVGIQTISAIYNGDSQYERSQSMPVTQTITVVSGGNLTTTSITSTLTQTTPGNAVLVTAHVVPTAANSPTPTGSVVFLESVSGGSYTYTDVKLDSGGSAQLSVPALATGYYSFTAAYQGDAAYSGSASGQQIVSASSSLLHLSIIKSTLPATLIAGEKLHGTVKVTISNPTQAAVKETITLDLFESSAPDPTVTAAQVFSHAEKINIRPGKTVTIAIPVSAATQSLSAMGYTLGAQLIEPSTSLSFSDAGPTTDVVAPVINLSDSLSLGGPASHQVVSGKTAAFTLEVFNHGNVIANGSTTIVTSFSTSSDGSSPVALSTLTPHLRITPGGHQIIRFSFKVPASFVPGTYYFLADVDPQNSLAETDLTDNLAITTSPLTVLSK